MLFQEGLNGSPFFALVPNPQAKNQVIPESASPAQIARIKRLNQKVLTRPFLATFLAVLTLLTTTLVGSVLLGEQSPDGGRLTLDALWQNPSLLRPGLSYGVTLANAQSPCPI